MKTSQPILLWLALLFTPISISAQLVSDGATNTLSNVTNTFPTSGVTVGTNGSFTLLVLANNCLLTNSGLSEIGRNTPARSNEVRLTSATARWHLLNPLHVGVSGSFNRLAISNGAAVQSSQGVIGSSSASASNNTAIVNGAGSVWNVASSFIVGLIGSGNRLEVSDGGRVNSDSGSIGEVATNNLVLVTGSGSFWSNAADLTIGSSRSANRLVVSNAGSVFVGGTVLLGNLAVSSNNQLVVNGGTLRVTNAAATGTLNVRRGTVTLDAGLIEVDRLLVTNSQGSFVFTGGTLSSKSTTATSGFSFSVGNNDGAATFILAGNGTHSFGSGGLNIFANSVLTGNGSISGNTLLATDGTLSPGAPIGTLSFSSSPLFLGRTLMEISRNSTVLTNDRVTVTGTITYGGSLTVTNIGPTAFVAGDRFPLFGGGAYAGSFSSLMLPPLGLGLTWTNKLLVDGSIEVLGLSVQTLPASGVASNTVTLNGVVTPGGNNATAWFEYGFTTNYGNITALQVLGSGFNPTNFSQVLTGLFGGVLYHFRAAASNSFGVTFGSDKSFPPFAQYIKASNTGSNDFFGWATAIDGDTLVVGARLEDSSATGVNGDQNLNDRFDSGAAYVFVRNGDSWVQQAYLKASNTGISDHFGTSVAVSGDTIVVGASDEDSNATGVNGDQNNDAAPIAGAAYVFVRMGTNWSQQAYLKASNTESGDRLGQSVAVQGDTVVLGAPFEDSNATGINSNAADNSATSSGAAYVFVRNGTNWTQQAYLKASNTEAFDFFGTSVAISDNTIAIGADGEDSNATGINGNAADNSATISGAAYVFVRNGTNWTQQAYLKASNTGPADAFGASLALAGNTIVVGAAHEDSNATGIGGDGNNNDSFESGAAYVFVRNGTTWSQQAYLKASNTESLDSFGGSVAVQGDTVVVCASGEDSNATGVNGDSSNNGAANSGAAYLFIRSSTNWSQQAYLKASNTESNDFFGFSAALSGDIVVISASVEDSDTLGVNGEQNNNGAEASGAVYVFGPPASEINLLQSGTNILNGGVSQQYLVAGTNIQTHSFTIRNTGAGLLTGLTITIDGADSARFSVTLNPVAPLMPRSNTTFDVRFAPTNPGTNTAMLHIASNDEDENPFDIQLRGVSLSFTEDRDNDGLNDASEFLMASFGFDLQLSQTNLVNTLFNNIGGAVSNLNGAGFFTQSQLQALNVNSPLLARDPFTGLFTLTISVEKATLLTNFFPFPMSAPQSTINADGKLEFQFSSPNEAAFFRLESR